MLRVEASLNSILATLGSIARARVNALGAYYRIGKIDLPGVLTLTLPTTLQHPRTMQLLTKISPSVQDQFYYSVQRCTH